MNPSRTVCILFTLLTATKAKFYPTNETDLSKCDVYYSRSGSKYVDFFTFEEKPSNESLILDFHFSVLAASDAHILLAPSSEVQKEDPAYEIVIGAGGNTFCDIRRMQKAAVKESVRITGLLSALDVRSFWLHITDLGEIGLGREGEELAFISWVDPDVLPVRAFSFSTWTNIEAKWFFNCKRDENITKIERPLTDLERLRKDLLRGYDPAVRPAAEDAYTVVDLAINTHFVSLDDRRSIIQIKGTAKLSWNDDKLRWNASEYGDIDNVHFIRREIWQPDLRLHSAVGENRLLLHESLVVVQSSGLAQWNPLLDFSSFCDGTDLTNWPKDEHKCKIRLAIWGTFPKIYFTFNTNESSFLYYGSTPWKLKYVDIDEQIEHYALLNMTFTIARNSEGYDMLAFAPFTIISITTLLSFWSSPFTSMKISLCCLNLLLSVSTILILALLIPATKHLPNYLVLYSSCLGAGLGAVIISILVINISRMKHKKGVPRMICNLLSLNITRILLCLYLPKSSEYGKLNDKSKERIQEMWILVGVVIDRLAFFLFLGLTIFALIKSF